MVHADIKKTKKIFNPHFICNLYIYIQQISVRIGCYGLRRGTH
jgi:hypothetical protein